ncbi:MAG: EF-P lysine aminoacylase EpmA [Gammaproteobacteria bacterium]|nr:EF-P lysine aminoacylase EpmA [Gammaproteobacteria bacterium]
MTEANDWAPSCAIETLHARAAALAATRAFFAERGVLEVNTPVLASHTVLDPAIESIAIGGRYLQTSPEYHMKRLLAAGAPSIYQLGPVFRQGEQGRWHNPEFLMLEWYRLDFDAERLMLEVEELVDCLLGPRPYLRIPYRQLLADRFGIDIDTASAGDLADICAQLGYKASPATPAEEALDLMLAAALNDHGKGRVFVTEYPASQAALARLSVSEGRPHAERFELVIDGVEIANGYHELADPDELAQRMAADAEKRRASGLPVPKRDERILAAQHHGLPNCAGVALGFDRLLALKLGTNGISPVLAFDWNRA